VPEYLADILCVAEEVDQPRESVDQIAPKRRLLFVRNARQPCRKATEPSAKTPHWPSASSADLCGALCVYPNLG
jgi:hypothetical protein